MRFQQKVGICGPKFQNSKLIFWLRAGKQPQLGKKFLKIRLKTGPLYGKRALIAKNCEKIFFGEMRLQQKVGICGLKFQNSKLRYVLIAGTWSEHGDKFLTKGSKLDHYLEQWP